LRTRCRDARIRGGLAAPAVLIASASLDLPARQEPQPPLLPPTFRGGTNIIRVDATVTDRNGTPLTSLTADDFEVREPTLTARLLDRRGATLVSLPVQPAEARTGFRIDLPPGSIAPGEFAILVEAAAGDHRREAVVPFRVLR
jgi:hypothetical protein